MDRIYVPLKLDKLDDEHAIFTGTDEREIEVQTFFGTIEGKQNWPGVMLPREVWEKLGCPTVLMLTLEKAEVLT